MKRESVQRVEACCGTHGAADREQNGPGSHAVAPLRVRLR
jgi:hypothetical protein